MTSPELVKQFYDNHKELVDYINSLNDEEYMYSKDGKWTAGQQLDHIRLCLMPIAQALSSKEFIEQKFGRVDRPTLNYEEVIRKYKAALSSGGKAPERFVPAEVSLSNREELSDEVFDMLDTIVPHLKNYSEDELNTLVLPHPLLGSLSIKELFFLMTYHATHHLRQLDLVLEVQANR
jgi:hypothetical protein